MDDLLILGGLVVDGTGARPPFPADVAIAGDRIVAMGDLASVPRTAHRVVDARGRIVCPGFIDVHVHNELHLLAGASTEPSDRFAGARMGVTTVFSAPDGFGFAPLPADDAAAVAESIVSINGRHPVVLDFPTPQAYLGAFAGLLPVNLVPQVPHQAIRVAAMGWAARPASADELATMVGLTEGWLDAGAVGLSLGLDYQPAAHATTAELIALARPVASAGGIVNAHLRHIALGRAGAWRELLSIGSAARVGVHVAHERLDAEGVALMDEAEARAAAEGFSVTLDGHLYPAGSTHLLYYVPLAQQVGGPAAVLERLRVPAYRSRLAAELDEALRGDAAEALAAYFSASRSGRHIGRSLGEIVASDPAGRGAGEVVVDLLADELPDALLVYPWGPSEREFDPAVRAALRHERFIVASDGLHHGPLPHPRGFGTFPRALRLGVHELGAVPIQAAVNRMTGLPAERFGLVDRGRVAVGAIADLVVLDAGEVADRATYEEPRLPPVGIDLVLVNGSPVIEGGVPTGGLPGRVVTRGR